MRQSDRPTRRATPWASQAGADYVRSVPDSGAPSGAASYAKGFPPETFQPIASGGTPPAGQDFNGVLLDVTAAKRWAEAGGIATFDQGFANAVGGYPAGALLASTTIGVLWQSTTDNNTADPDAGGAGWQRLTYSPGDTSQNVIRHPSGFVEQWGQVSYPSTGQPVVNVGLIVPFADAAYGIQATPAISQPSTNAGTWIQVIASSVTPTGFSVQYQSPGGSSARPSLDGFYWRCIGKGA